MPLGAHGRTAEPGGGQGLGRAVQHGFGFQHSPASSPAGPAMASALPLLCLLGNQSSFLTEIGILLVDMASVRGQAWVTIQTERLPKRGETEHYVGERDAGKEPVGLQVTGCANVRV